MSWKDPEVSFRSRDLQFVHFLVNDLAFRRDDNTHDRVLGHLFTHYLTAAIFSAFARTSSIVPTM